MIEQMRKTHDQTCAMKLEYHGIMEMKKREFPGRKKRLQRESYNRSHKSSSMLWGGPMVLPNVYSAMGFTGPKDSGQNQGYSYVASRFPGSSCSLIGWPWPNLGMLVLLKIKLIFSQHNLLLGYAHGLAYEQHSGLGYCNWNVNYFSPDEIPSRYYHSQYHTKFQCLHLILGVTNTESILKRLLKSLCSTHIS